MCTSVFGAFTSVQCNDNAADEARLEAAQLCCLRARQSQRHTGVQGLDSKQDVCDVQTGRLIARLTGKHSRQGVSEVRLIHCTQEVRDG